MHDSKKRAGLLAEWEVTHVGTVTGIPTLEPVPRADRLLGPSHLGGIGEEHVGAREIDGQHRPTIREPARLLS